MTTTDPQPVDPEQVAKLRRILEEPMNDHDRDIEDIASRVYRSGDPLPPAAQAALDRIDRDRLDQRHREATGQG